MERVCTKRKKLISLLLFIVMGILLFVTGCGLEVNKEEFAEDAAKTVISNILKSPSSAIWYEVECLEYDGNGKYIVYVDVEASNSFGGMIRTKYFVCVSDFDLDEETFSYSSIFGYLECSGKNDTTTFNLIKSFNKFDHETMKKASGGENGEFSEETSDFIGGILFVLLFLFIGYFSLYYLGYKKGKLQNLEKIFLPFEKLVGTVKTEQAPATEVKSEEEKKENGEENIKHNISDVFEEEK